MSAKTYLRLLQIGLVASLFIVFCVFKDLLFPFITSKQLPFNILMEILFAFWLVFVLRYPEYRPKKNLIVYGLAAYLLAILISCLVSVNFTLSFWGNAERMLGFFSVIHFLIFYLILITTFRSWAEWRWLFLISVAVATLVSLQGLLGTQAYSTIGNTAYVSGYLIFNIYFALLLFFRNQDKVWRWLYALPIFIMLLEFRICHTSGAIIGLFLSVLLLFFLIGIFHKSKLVRRSSLAVLIIAVVAVVVIFSQSQTAWFQNSFLKNLTTEKATFQTRLISWRGAAADFKYHPIFGTGFGNYAIIFDKHFDPKFFNYATTETYFDRAHNNLIDITSTTGIVGLATYLSIFVIVFYYLWQEFKRNGRRAGAGEESARHNLEIIIIVSLIAAYFIQNLAVFDSFVTYMGLMLVLGYIYWLVQIGKKPEEEAEELETKPGLIKGPGTEIIVLLILLIVAYIFTSQTNLKPWGVFKGVIVGYGDIMEGKYVEGVDAYRQALIGTPLDHDGRVTLINLATSNPEMFAQMQASTAKANLDYIISLAQADLRLNPADSLMQMQLAQILNTAARVNYQDTKLFNYYSSQALEAIDRSIAASPGRIPVYLVKAEMQMMRGEKDESVATVNYAISLNPGYYEGYCHLARFYIYLKDNKSLLQPLNECLDKGGIASLNSDLLLKSAISFEASQNDYPRALSLAQKLATVSGASGEVWFNLAKLYMVTGDAAQADIAAQKAVSLDPQFKAAWASFLQSVGKGVATSTASTTGQKK